MRVEPRIEWYALDVFLSCLASLRIIEEKRGVYLQLPADMSQQVFRKQLEIERKPSEQSQAA